MADEPDVVDDLPSNSAIDLHIRVRNDDGTVTERWVSLDWLFNRIDTELDDALKDLPPPSSSPARLG